MLLQGHRRRGREKGVLLSFGDATTHFSLLPGTDRRDVEGERELAPVSAAPRSSPPPPMLSRLNVYILLQAGSGTQ